jgi:endonuclease YncB( thermonuclease family)
MDAAPPAIVVIDGDTFRLNGERIRILNIDAPEMPSGAKCEAEGYLALAARDRLLALLKSGPLAVERHGKDQYRRTLAYIRVSGADVGEMLIAGHFAAPWQGHKHDWCGR